ncbi:hypothetical protein ACWCWQ_02045 [Streptomyces sp. NPDC001571]
MNKYTVVTDWNYGTDGYYGGAEPWVVRVEAADRSSARTEALRWLWGNYAGDVEEIQAGEEFDEDGAAEVWSTIATFRGHHEELSPV